MTVKIVKGLISKEQEAIKPVEVKTKGAIPEGRATESSGLTSVQTQKNSTDAAVSYLRSAGKPAKTASELREYDKAKELSEDLADRIRKDEDNDSASTAHHLVYTSGGGLL